MKSIKTDGLTMDQLAERNAEYVATIAALAAENGYLLPKAASELSNAWVLHKYLIGIQAAIMHLEAGRVSAAQDWLLGTIFGPGFNFPDDLKDSDDIDAWAQTQMRDSISFQRAMEIIKSETPNTNAYLAEVRALGRIEGINFAAARLAAAFNNGFVNKATAEVYDVVGAVLDAKNELGAASDDGLSGEYAEKALKEWEAQLRNEVKV